MSYLTLLQNHSYKCDQSYNQSIHKSNQIKCENFIIFPQASQERGTSSTCWNSNLSINKRTHILYGNRRNLGYKYFSWNCDRGLLSKNKIEDVRAFASRHKPHFIGVSEVDLRRNENNTNDKSNNEFTTEQAQEALKIDNYRLLFPSSWLMNGKARIIVYVHDDIKAKMKEDDAEDSHLQHVLLEVGFGKSKTHLVDFYYREWKSCVTGESSPTAQN